MPKNKHNSKEKTLCCLDLGWIYLFCHFQRQCAMGCRGLLLTSWDWEMPPHFGMTAVNNHPWILPCSRAEEKAERRGTHEWQRDISLLQLLFSLSLLAKARAAATSRGSTRKKNTSSPLRREVSLSEGTKPWGKINFTAEDEVGMVL